MTHSPGPWRLAKSGQIVDVNNRAIARVCNTWRAPMATTLKISALLLLYVLIGVLEYHWYPYPL